MKYLKLRNIPNIGMKAINHDLRGGQRMIEMKMMDYLRTMLEGPIVGHMAVSDENHRMIRKIFFSAAVLESPARLVIHLPEVGMANVRHNLLVRPYLAALFGDAVTFQSVQIKGEAMIRSITDAEEIYFDKMLQRLADLNYPDKLFTMQHKPLLAIEITIEEIYNQTPGTGAGDQLVF